MDTGSQGSRLPAFRDFVPEIVDALQDVHRRTPFDEFNIAQAYVYWVAELFETTNPEAFTYTDGGSELGIDFFVQDEDRYYIYQCKAVTLETLETADKPPLFSADDVNQLLEGVEYLRDEASTFTATRKEVRDLRTRYQRSLRDSPESTHLVATLAVLGELTTGGRDRFEAARRELSERGVTLRLVDWSSLFEASRRLEAVSTKDLRFSLRVDDIEKDILRQPEWIFALVYASDLVDAYEKSGVQLFDLNVRNELRGSKVNKSIVETLSRAQGRRRFHHLNNGLLVVCNDYRLPRRDGEPIRVNGPQVVNGCQTVTSLARAYHDLTPRDQEEFRSNVRIQVKIIRQPDQDLLDDVVITTNNQNPMRPRNLRSNRREQRDIQKSFRALPDKWFYVRKDGEFEAMLQKERQVSWFKKKDYDVGGGRGRARYRKVDNEDIAKSWFSWVGSSGRVTQGGVDYFGDDAVYNRVFLLRPSDQFWDEFREPSFEKPAEELYEAFPPTAHQLLVAQAVATYVRFHTPSSLANRKASIARLVRFKKIDGDPETGEPRASQAQIARALSADREYVVGGYLANIEYILVELIAFVLCRRYGSLGPSVAQMILRVPDIAQWTRQAFAASDPASMKGDGTVLWRVLDFVRWSLTNYFTEFRYEIEASPRPKMFFARRQSIMEMRRILCDSDDMARDFVKPWKSAEGQSFLESLPELAE